MGQIQKIPFSCRSGKNTIRGYAFIPDGIRLPIAVVSHGFMANQSSTKDYARFLAEHGYASFCFDFPGGSIVGSSTGSTKEMTIFTEKQDLLSVISYAQNLEITDSSRLTLLGCSQGGLVSALAAADLRDEVEQLILFYPALCIPDDARSGKMMFARFDPSHIPEVLHCGPMTLGGEYARSVLDLDVYEAISPYEGRVLIIHGTEDQIVDISYARRAAEVYSHASLIEVENGKHGLNRQQIQSSLAIVAEFLEGTLPDFETHPTV